MARSGIWTTEKINNLLKNYEKTGVFPSNNPFKDRDVRYREADINYGYTDEEVLELAKIEENILYFGENYAKVMTDVGITLINLRKYQKNNLLQLKKYRFNIWLASRQIGKCVTADTFVNVKNIKTGEAMSVPLGDLVYSEKKNKKLMDYIEWGLFKLSIYLQLIINNIYSIRASL